MGQETGSYQTWRNDNSFGTDLNLNEPSLRKIRESALHLPGTSSACFEYILQKFKGLHRVLEGKPPDITNFTTLKIFSGVAISQFNANSGWNFLQQPSMRNGFSHFGALMGTFLTRESKAVFKSFLSHLLRSIHPCSTCMHAQACRRHKAV